MIMRRACVRVLAGVRVCLRVCGWVGGVWVCVISYYIGCFIIWCVRIDWNMDVVVAAACKCIVAVPT